jgi:hypothetical protein
MQAVIVPLGPATADFDVNLASFAVDPDFANTQIVAVAPAALGGPAISALWHQAGFYGLNLRLVVTPEALDTGAALEVGAGHASCETLILLSASTFARQRGWLGSLCRSFRELDRPAVISPTLLYEDDSIKFAGLHHRPAAALQPAEAIASAFAGYPREWLDGAELTPVLAATTECCVLSRVTLRRLDGFSREFVTPVDIGAICAFGSGLAGAAGETGAGAAGAGGATTPADSGIAVTGSAFATIDATFSAGRVPVSPASRFANVSSLSAGTSMVSGITRGAEMRSMETMM